MEPGFYKRLSTRKDQNQLRHFTNWEGKVDFFSNDYLGIAQRATPVVKQALYGSTGSRLLSGHHAVHEALEKTAAQFFKAPSALLFNSGYDANVGLFSALPQRGEIVIYDQKIHASVRDGLRLSNARAYHFLHNDLDDLETKLKQAETPVFVAIESIYSMDGDRAPVVEVLELCEKYKAYLIIDEAHAVGVFGEHGEGCIPCLESEKIIKVATFGKAFGSHGAVVLGSKDVVLYLMNFARSFIYTTALSLESVTRLISAFQWIQKAERERIRLRTIIDYYVDQTEQKQWDANRSPIQYHPLHSIDWSSLSRLLEDHAIAIKPIFPPTVPQGEERLRISLHSYNTKSEIDLLLQCIEQSTYE